MSLEVMDFAHPLDPSSPSHGEVLEAGDYFSLIDHEPGDSKLVLIGCHEDDENRVIVWEAPINEPFAIMDWPVRQMDALWSSIQAGSKKEGSLSVKESLYKPYMDFDEERRLFVAKNLGKVIEPVFSKII